MIPARYYQRHRAHILQNVAQAGDVIHWDNNRAQANNKVVGPAFEDYILYNLIKEIDSRLFDDLQAHYYLKMAEGCWIL